jgi:uncharacterized repeat protein (TIGR01451 family)
MSLGSGKRLAAGTVLALLVLAVGAPVSAAHLGRSHARHRGHLRLSLNGSPTVVEVGQQVTYTATITNRVSAPSILDSTYRANEERRDQDARRRPPRGRVRAAFRDVLPGKATLDSATPSQGSCSGNPTVECNLGSLAAGASATVTITVTTTQPGPMVDRGWISTNPPGGWHDQRIVTSYVRSLNANLDLRLNGSPPVVDVGQQVTYTATILNHGPGAAATAAFQDVLPGKATLDSATPSQGSCSGNPTVECNLGSLAAGASATVTITVTTTQPGPMVDRGWISTNPPGGWHDQRVATTSVRVGPATTPTTTVTTTGATGTTTTVAK